MATKDFMEEIRSHDIYTVRSSDSCPTIPSISTSSYSTRTTSHVPSRDPFLVKSNLKYRSIMKKLSSQQCRRNFLSLPALLEEDNAYLPSVPMYTPMTFGDGHRDEGLNAFKPNEAPQSRSELGEKALLAILDDSFDNNFDEKDHVEKEFPTITTSTVTTTVTTTTATTSRMNDESDDEDENSLYSDDDGDESSSLEVLDDESWVDLTKQATDPPAAPSSFTQAFSSSSAPSSPSTMWSSSSYGSAPSPDRVTPPPFGNGEEYIRLLREAQKESNQSSARVSLASSRRDTPRDSPKSPPNSPNTEMVVEAEEAPPPVKGVFINYYNRDGDFVRVEKNVETDWIWDWSSRPDQTPPKEWKFVHPGGKRGRRGASIRRLMVGNSSLFSRDVLYTLLLTNVLSLLLGTGIGIWLSKKSGGSGGTMSLTAMSIN